MPRLSLRSHVKHLQQEDRLSPKTIENYSSAIDRLNIDVVDTDRLSEFWDYLGSCLPEFDSEGVMVRGKPYSYVMHANALASSMLSLQGITAKGPGYDNFRARLGRYTRHSPAPYTEEQVKLLLRESRMRRGFGLYRLLIFLVYTGAKISYAQGVKISDFKEVPGYDKVLAVSMRARKHRYTAMISRKAAEQIQFYNLRDDDLISGHDGTKKSSFTTYNRALLAYTITSAGISQQVTENRAITDSFRKFFAAKMFEDGIGSDDISLLMGQVPNTLAYKAHTAAGGRPVENVIHRLAAAYSKSSLATWEAWS